ncbi:MAG: hypothetical protein ABIZ56_10925, partial [Chthoniobacteraceae bacterium]
AHKEAAVNSVTETAPTSTPPQLSTPVTEAANPSAPPGVKAPVAVAKQLEKAPAPNAPIPSRSATLPPPPMVKPPGAPNPVVAPAPSGLAAASNDPRLLQLEATFKARFDAEVQKPYLASIAALNQSYLGSLERIRPGAQAKGRLDEVTAVDAEKVAIGKGEGVPSFDAPGTPDSIKSHRTAYRAAINKYTGTRTSTAAQLYALHLTSLDKYVSELTRANNIDGAKKVKAVRDEIAAQKPEIPRPVAAELPKTTPVAATSSQAAVPGGSVREAAEWIYANGGNCTISRGTAESSPRKAQELPPGRFEILRLTLDSNQSKLPPPTDADMHILRGLKSLNWVYVLTHSLTDDGFDFLADNANLTSVALHADGLTDGVLNYLAGARKLTEIKIGYARRFTGRGLGEMRWLRGLTKANFFSSGVSDEGLRALLAAPKLRTLSLDGGGATATDAGLALIAGHRALTELILDRNKGFTDDGFANLAKLKSLSILSVAGTSFGDVAAAALVGHNDIRQLDLKETALTDAGLAKLARLTRLQSLNLHGTNVTAAGVEAFKKAVPKCVVVK